MKKLFLFSALALLVSSASAQKVYDWNLTIPDSGTFYFKLNYSDNDTSNGYFLEACPVDTVGQKKCRKLNAPLPAQRDTSTFYNYSLLLLKKLGLDNDVLKGDTLDSIKTQLRAIFPELRYRIKVNDNQIDAEKKAQLSIAKVRESLQDSLQQLLLEPENEKAGFLQLNDSTTVELVERHCDSKIFTELRNQVVFHPEYAWVKTDNNRLSDIFIPGQIKVKGKPTETLIIQNNFFGISLFGLQDKRGNNPISTRIILKSSDGTV